MLRDIVYSPTLEYRTNERYNPRDLYEDLFLNSKKCDLLLGYFSTSAIKVLNHSFSQFILNNGVIRIIANNVLSIKDSKLFENLEQDHIDLLDFSKLEDLLSQMNDDDKKFFSCLKFLICHDRIQFRFIKPKAGKGISHYKSVLVNDGVDYVYGKGSCNFTASGLVHNLEEMTVSMSWNSSVEESRSLEFLDYFEKIWRGENDYIETVDSTEIKTWVSDHFSDISLEELVENATSLKSRGTKKVSEAADEYVKSPIKFPYESGPREYQWEAYKSWIHNNKRGLFVMATGTGKTLTALNCVLQEYLKSNSYRCVIVVPTAALMEQWDEQIQLFGFSNVFILNSLTSLEKKALDIICKTPEGKNFILVVSYGKFARPDFYYKYNNLISHSMLIADEAHNASANKSAIAFRRYSPETILGLTATPEKRFSDVESFYQEVFSSTSPYTYSYTMKEAIENEILTPYKYYPIPVRMTEDEFKRYDEVTQSIVQLSSMDKLNKEQKERLKNMSIYRRSIINQASGKESKILNVLSNIRRRQGNLKYTLIYSPIGYERLRVDEQELNEAEHRITRYTSLISNKFETATIVQYVGGSNKEWSKSVLDSFMNGKNEMLISMKCLDEGVDLPIAQNAIFVSSSGSPREFIQRRGRVLRSHPEKELAFVYDLFVIPPINKYPSTATKKVIKDEIHRLEEFASLSLNRGEVLVQIEDIKNAFDVN
jgi:superfamily II DNA or RNA helicase